jgi:hypothetical protein
MVQDNTSLSDRATHELRCAERIVARLFEETGLTRVVGNRLTVTVGGGNWISFVGDQPVSKETVRKLQRFAGVFARPAEARSKSSPSLHLVNLGSGEKLRGHVDAHYWARNPLRHAIEFLTKRTVPPSELLSR